MSRVGLLQAVRGVVVANIPPGFVLEPKHYAGMETWVVPTERAPKTYDKRPPPIVAVGERKSYVSVFLMGLYYDPTMSGWLEKEWEASGYPLRRGRASIQLRHLDDVPSTCSPRPSAVSPSRTCSPSSTGGTTAADRLAALSRAGTLGPTPRGGAVW